MCRTLTIAAVLAIAVGGAPLARADQPDPPDSWTEFADAVDAADAGWYTECGISQLLVVSDDCACGSWSVGCQTTVSNWLKRFGLAVSVPLAGVQSLRFQHKASWTGYDQVAWHLFLIMEPTAAEAAAGIDAKQMRWQYPKTGTWTEVNLAFDAAEWQWRSADSGMWMVDDPDGNTELTTLVCIEWYTAILYGLSVGDRVLLDDLTLAGTGVAVPLLAPDAPAIAATYPNPANPAVTVALDLPRDATARVDLLDTAGRHVRTLHDGWLAAGRRTLRWDGRDDAGRAVASGTYLVLLRTAKGRDRATVTLVR